MEFNISAELWDGFNSLLKNHQRANEVGEIYGKFSADCLRENGIISCGNLSGEKSRQFIEKIQNSGRRFNYFLDIICMDNLEFTRRGQVKLKRLLDQLIKFGANSITAANPYIAMWIRRNYPDLSLTVSSMADVDSVSKAKFWEDLGAKSIIFPSHKVNRDFNLIKLLRRSLKCKMQLIANNGCICNCLNYGDHSVSDAHLLQEWHQPERDFFDYRLVNCRLKMLKDPANLIRSDWIRPEDISLYQGLGIDSIKLLGEGIAQDKGVKIIKAYLDREYQGNLLDLLPRFQEKDPGPNKKFTERPEEINRFIRMFLKTNLFIDNQRLTGVLENIPDNCNLASCDSCAYCAKKAKQAVKFDNDRAQDAIVEYEKIISGLYKRGA